MKAFFQESNSVIYMLNVVSVDKLARSARVAIASVVLFILLPQGVLGHIRLVQHSDEVFQKLGEARREFGVPEFDHIWGVDKWNYASYQLFPAGSATARYLVNLGDESCTMAYETTHGHDIRKEWYVRLNRVQPEPARIAPGRLKGGTVLRFLGSHGYDVAGPIPSSAEGALKRQQALAVYYTGAHVSDTLFAYFLEADFGMKNWGKASDEITMRYDLSKEQYPMLDNPYPITKSEKDYVRKNLLQDPACP